MKSQPPQNPDDIYKKQERPRLRRSKGGRGRRRMAGPRGGPGGGRGSRRRSGEQGHFSHHEGGGSSSGLWIAVVLFGILLLYFGALFFVKHSSRNKGVTLQEIAVPTATPAPVATIAPVAPEPPAGRVAASGPSRNEDMKAFIAAWEDNRDTLSRVRVTARREDPGRALETLLRAQETTPEWLRLKRMIADMTFERQDYSNAVPRLLDVMSIDPESMEPRTKLAISLLKIGDLEAAETVARWTLELSPLSVDLHQVIADSLLARGQFENALPHLRKIAETSPFDLDLQIQYARLLGQVGQYARAATVFEKIQQQAPHHGQTYYHFAICHKQNGRPELAIDLLKVAVENCGASFVAPWLLGEELLSLQEHEGFGELQALLAP